MKTTKNNMFLVCQKCLHRISEYGEICLDIMGQVCENDSNDVLTCYFEQDLPDSHKTVVKFLETKNYIVSTERGNNKIAIISTAKDCSNDDMDRYFCWCKKT